MQTTRVGEQPTSRIVQAQRGPGVLSANLLMTANRSLCNKVDTPTVRIRKFQKNMLTNCKQRFLNFLTHFTIASRHLEVYQIATAIVLYCD